MDKLSMCRICLVENVRMFAVAHKNLQETYEKLTDVPLVTEDRRPILACYLCYAKLKQCWRFKRKCLEAEKLFAQMLNSCEQKPIKVDNSDFVGGLVKTSIEIINIVDGGPVESDAIEFEVPVMPDWPDDTERQNEFIEVKVEHQSDELEPENLDNSYPDPDVEVPVQRSRSDSEDDVPLLRIKAEVEDVEEEAPQQPVSRNKRSIGGAFRAPKAKKPKVDKRRTKIEDTITAEPTKTEQHGSNIFQTTLNIRIKPITKLEVPFMNTRDNNRINTHTGTSCITSKKCELNCKISNIKGTDSDDINTHDPLSIKEKPFKCDQCHRSYTVKSHLTCHIRTHTGEKPYECDTCHRCFAIKSHLKSHLRTHTGATQPFKCDICQRRFTLKNNLSTHVLVHTGEKPYKCHICKRGFTQKIHLRSHIPIHTGDKPFKCDICHRSFSLKHSLKRHIKIVHTNEKCYTSSRNRVKRAKKKDKIK